MKSSVIVAATSIATLGAIAAAQVTVSNNVNQAIDLLLTQANQSQGFAVSVMEDSGTILSRQLVIEIDLQPEPDFSIRFVANNNVRQFPWGASISHEIAISEYSYQNLFSGSNMHWVKENLVDQPFLSGTTNIDLISGSDSEWQTKAFFGEIENILVQFNAMHAEFEIDTDMNFSSDLVWPGLSLSEKNTVSSKTISLVDLHQSYNGNLTSWPVILGESQFGLKQFRLEDSTSNEQVVLEGLQGNTLAAIDNNALNSAFDVHIDSIQLSSPTQDIHIQDSNAKLSFSSNNAQSFIELQRMAQSLDFERDPSAFDQLLPVAESLLQAGSEINLKELSTRINDVNIRGSAAVKINGNTIPLTIDPFYIAKIKPFLEGSAQLHLDKSVSREPVLAEYLMGMLFMGVLVEKDDSYSMKAEYKDGSAMLNGNLIPLPL